MLKEKSRKRRTICHINPNGLLADFSSATMEVRGQWDDSERTERKDLSTKNLVSSKKLSFKNEGKIKALTDKQNLREFVSNRASL